MHYRHRFSHEKLEWDCIGIVSGLLALFQTSRFGKLPILVTGHCGGFEEQITYVGMHHHRVCRYAVM